MLVFRLGAAGAPKRTILLLLVELWGAFALVVVVLVAISWITGPSKAIALQRELIDFTARWSRLSRSAQALFTGGLVVAILILLYALLSVRRAMREYPM